MDNNNFDVNKTVDLVNKLHKISEKVTQDANQYQARYDVFKEQFKAYCEANNIDYTQFKSISEIKQFLNEQTTTLVKNLTDRNNVVQSIINLANQNDWTSVAKALGIPAEDSSQNIEENDNSDSPSVNSPVVNNQDTPDTNSILNAMFGTPQEKKLVDVPMVSEDGNVVDSVAPTMPSTPDDDGAEEVDIPDDSGSFYGDVKPIPQTKDVVDDSVYTDDNTSSNSSTSNDDNSNGSQVPLVW